LLSGFAKNFALLVVGFLLFELGRRALFPSVAGPVEKRMESLHAERDSCSILFVGPSYVDDQVIPQAFNQEAERIGLGEKACKFGTTALRGYELRTVIERVLRQDWPRLRLVVIDITLGDTIDFKPENWLNQRVIEWHTFGVVPWLFDYYAREPPERGDALPRFTAHAKHLLAHYAEVGRGVEALRSFNVFERLRPPAEPTVEPPRRRKRRVRGARYERHVAKMIATRRTSGPKYGSSDWALELRSLVRDHDKEAYFLIAPVLYSPSVPRRSVRGKDRLVVLNFNDPLRYPELYEQRVRGNTSHIRRAGSVRYSELLANEIARHKRGAR
jgi:hypothetical protein